jgi:NAD(P)H-hydrate epimerase
MAGDRGRLTFPAATPIGGAGKTDNAGPQLFAGTAVVTPRILTREQVRQFDRIACERFGIPAIVLMENAARGATDVLVTAANQRFRRVVILCGPGNNGGDGLVMARHLHLRGWQVRVVLLAGPEHISREAKINLEILAHTCVPVDAGRGGDFKTLERLANDSDWIVDAMLGTGASPPLRPPFHEIVQLVNRSSARRFAVDLPTGLDGDCTCESSDGNDVVFSAEITATFVARKPVMQTAAGKRWCGQIRIVDIGAPPEVFEYLDFSSGKTV